MAGNSTAADGEERIAVFVVAEHAALRDSLELLLADEGTVTCGWSADISASRDGLPPERTSCP